MSNHVIVDGREIPIEGERNLLELVRKAGIEIPTFCYHSDLSVYGACRLCIVDVQGRGVVASCSTPPEPDMVVKTSTEEVREMRKIALELILANHDQSCTTCPKSKACKLQELARRFGIDEVRFKSTLKNVPVDASSPSIVRDPNKCVLCGDCVRFCAEIQGVGAIDFAHRGADVSVGPAFGKELDKVECINCGQCAAVCPTGALTIRQEVDEVWRELDNEEKMVVVQIAPAVRVALGEEFGLPPGTVTTGQIVAALKALGFGRVFDTCFAADLTVIEEATEFLKRVEKGERLPQFTSCCPAWVKFVEQYYPDLLPNLSTCRSPQQMFGSLAKAILPEMLGVQRENLVVVSVMPCTAKKFEARRSEFETAGIPDVDHVLTTQELARMIDEKGLRFHDLQPESLDLPLGFKTGAGVIFGASGGVTEAVLRFAYEKISGKKLDSVDFKEVRGDEDLREAVLEVDGKRIRLAVVHSLGKAKEIAEQVKAGTAPYDLIEVMACPGGCIGGAGQPVNLDFMARKKRSEGLYEADKTLQLHKPQENPYIADCYNCHLGEVGGECAHRLLHTRYQSRRRISDEDLSLMDGTTADKLPVRVCVGTSCYLRGAQDLLHKLIRHIEENNLQERVDVKATFCLERCDRGPNITVGGTVCERCTLERAIEVLHEELAKLPAPSA